MNAYLTKILEKYKLQENLEWQVDEKKELIIKRMKNITSENYYSVLLAFMDLRVSKDKKFIGTIDNNGFIIRKRIKPFILTVTMAKVTAEFKKVDGKTKLIAKVNGMRKIVLIIRLIISTLLCLLALLVVLEALIPPIGEVNPFPHILILAFIMTIFVLIPLILGQRNVRNMKTELNKIIE